MNANDFVALALKSPLYPLLGNTMLLTVAGRKTGRKIRVPVNYYQDGNSLWIVSNRDRKWWRNLRGGGEVEIRLHGRDLHGYGETLLDENEVAAQLCEYVRRSPGSARYLGVRLEGGGANPEDLAKAAKERLFVRICLV